MLRAVDGETTARVTPAARLTAIELACGLIAGATSIAALNGEALAWVSLVASTASTSRSPIREKPATTPAVTHLPRASITLAPAGTATLAPGGDHAAVTQDNGAALDRLGAVADHDASAGDRGGLGGRRDRDEGEEECERPHFTSPSPGWPSSKSLTGRRRGSFMS